MRIMSFEWQRRATLSSKWVGRPTTKNTEVGHNSKRTSSDGVESGKGGARLPVMGLEMRKSSLGNYGNINCYPEINFS